MSRTEVRAVAVDAPHAMPINHAHVTRLMSPPIGVSRAKSASAYIRMRVMRHAQRPARARNR